MTAHVRSYFPPCDSSVTWRKECGHGSRPSPARPLRSNEMFFNVVAYGEKTHEKISSRMANILSWIVAALLGAASAVVIALLVWNGFLYLEYLRQPPLARPFSHGSFALVGDDGDWTFKPQFPENAAVSSGFSGASATRYDRSDIYADGMAEGARRHISQNRPPIEGGPNTHAACESADVRDPSLGLRLGCGSGLCRKLEHCCFLTLKHVS
jgi:hypothetical protein